MIRARIAEETGFAGTAAEPEQNPAHGRGRRGAPRHAGGGRLAEPLIEHAARLPRERRGSCVPPLQPPGALPAHRPRRMGICEAVDLHVGEKRLLQEESTLGRPSFTRMGAVERGVGVM